MKIELSEREMYVIRGALVRRKIRLQDEGDNADTSSAKYHAETRVKEIVKLYDKFD